MSNAENYVKHKMKEIYGRRAKYAMAEIKMTPDPLLLNIDRNGVSVTAVSRIRDWRKKMKKLNDEQFKGLV